MAFERADYMGFDSLLSEEQRLVRDTVGSWVDERVLPIIEDAAWEGRFPKELVPEMAGMHLFGHGHHHGRSREGAEPEHRHPS